MTAGRGAPRRVDVVVIGDGPAGSALASACARAGVDVVLVGPDDEWSATYSTWLDELDGVDLPPLEEVLTTRLASITVHTERPIEVPRAYAVFDNGVLRTHVRRGVEIVSGRVVEVSAGERGRRLVSLDGGGELHARVVVDASGWPSAFARRDDDRPPAWQTALGVVLEEPPPGDLGRPTLMDFRPVRSGAGRSTVGPRGVTTFCYALPLADGWLVEETVLAARPAVEPIALLPRLAARLGRHPDDVLAAGVRTEYVRIPMGGGRPALDSPVVAFGAAAGYVHAATGFSVAASLRAAPRVAEAIGRALGSTSGEVDPEPIAAAVWPRPARRSRVLHDYGLETLLRLDDDETRCFFDAFFALPLDDVRRYMRIDSSPGEVAGVMLRLFSSTSWSMRRRLASGNPLAFARLLRP
jgi:lycopene beta-cyclase